MTKTGIFVVPQPAELPDQVEPGVVIAPIAVVEVAGDQHEIDAFLDGQVDQPREGAPRRSPNPLDGRVLVPLQPLERAVEVDIGRVEKRDRHDEEPNPGSLAQRATSARRRSPLEGIDDT